MGSTREKMLEVSLRLFARDGFEAVSTSAIAGELGMAKSALYKHFPDKRAIFDSLVEEMLEQHRAAVLAAGVALKPEESAALAYATTPPKDMANLGVALFAHWTADESAVAFRRMLSLERYRDEPGPGSWNVDWVVDAVDTISTKLALAEFADKKGLPLVSSMGGGNKLNPEHFAFADIYETVNCPLCRIMRKEARKRGIASLRVLYSKEHPAPTETEPGSERRDRSDLGTMSYVPPIMGQMLAGWVIRQLLQLDDGGCA